MTQRIAASHFPLCDRAVWVAALDYIERYGPDALMEAQRRVVALFGSDDWHAGVRRGQVARAVAELQRRERRPGEALH